MNKVIVKVIGMQKDAIGEENRIEMTSIGKHYYKNGINYVLYDDSDAGGMGNISTLLKIADGCVTLIRKGDVMQEQRFEVDELSSSVYRTPFGNMTLSVRTSRLEIDYGSVSGDIQIDYALTVNGRWQSDNRLHIHVLADRTASNQLN